MSLKKYDKATGQWKTISSAGGGGSNKASGVYINDIGSYYNNETVEGALQEIATKAYSVEGKLNTLSARISDHFENHPSGGGSGGGGSMPTLTLDDGFEWTTSDGSSETKIPVFFASPNMGDGIVYIMVNNVEVKSAALPEGASEIVVPPIGSGKNIKVIIYAKDRAGLMSNRLTFSVTAGGIEMKIISDTTADYNINNKIIFKYQITCSSSDPIYLHMTIDGNEQNIVSQTGYNTHQITGLDIGIHYVSVYASSGPYQTKPVEFIMVVVSKDYIYLSSLFDQEAEYEAGIPINVPYRISIDSTDTFEIELYIDGKIQKTLSSKPSSLYWTISKLNVGTHELKIKVYHPQDEKLVNELILTCNCVQGDYSPIECVQDASLIAWFDATERSNKDVNKEFWYDKINGYEGKLHNFNYGSNGWIQQKGKSISELVLTGTAYVEIDMKPFADNMPNGGAIELYFKTRDCGNQDARVLDITDIKTPYRGVYVSTEKVSFASAAQTLTGAIGEEEYMHVIVNIDRIEGFVHIYVNGVSVRQGKLSDVGSGTTAILEAISHDQKIYIGSTKGESNFGMCEVSHLRIYDMPLSMEQCLQNYMSCIDDLEKQKELYNFNYSDVSLIPAMYITMAEGEYNQNTHEFKTMTDLDKVEVSVKYVSSNDQLFGSSFESPYALMNIQGTSSKGYTYKNFNIQLKDQNRQDMAYSPYADCVPQPLFCLKCNYMESTNAHNVGIADFVHHELYSQKNPAQKINNKIRATVEGFPIELYINGVSHGIYDFNLDRYSYTAFGYDLPELNNKCMCYEVSANSNNTAGAFVKWTPSTGIDEHAWYSASFSGIYPISIQNAQTDDFAKIKNLIAWVCDSTDDDFIENFTTYFDKESVLRYYLLVMSFGMVDSLGKNMKLTTFDGVKWYIQVYDCDTAFGLDNTGALKYDVDMEMGDGQFNTDSSRLWVRVRELFAADLAAEYANMRKTFLTPEKLKKYLFDNNIHKIPQRLYNYSTQKKYLDDNGKWISFSNGNRYYQLNKWIDERFLYMDTLMQYYASTNTNVTIRTSIEGEIYLDVQTYSPMYVRIMWRNTPDGSATSEVKIGRNKTVRIYGRSDSKDQEILIYGSHYIKSLGNLSGLQPTRLRLNEADRLIEIGCPDNPELMEAEIQNCKYLQEVNFTNCVNLGILESTQKLQLEGCSNLRKLYVDGTQITSIVTNMDGGNLTDIRLPSTLQELTLKNQYSLKTLGLPCATNISETPENIKKQASKIALISITNCPLLESFTNEEPYIGSSAFDLDGQQKTSAQLKEVDNFEELKQAIIFGNPIANVDNLYIENSFVNQEVMSFKGCDGLRNLELIDLPNLKTLIFGENCTGNKWEKDGAADDLQGTFDMDNIKITRCDNIEKLKFHSFTSRRSWVNFTNKTIDLTEKFPNLKEFSMNIASQGLETLILPSSLNKLFIKTISDYQDIDWVHKWTKENCLLKNIYFKEDHPDMKYEGVDLGNRQMYELELSCCPQTPSIKNVNTKNKYTNPIFNNYKNKGNDMFPMVAVTGKIDMSEFNNTTIEGWFINLNFDDPDNKIEFVYPDWDALLETVTTVGPMFQYCTNSNFTWEFAMRFFPLIKNSMVLHTMYRNAMLQPNGISSAVNLINNHKGVISSYKYGMCPFYGTNLKYIDRIASSSDGALGDLFQQSNIIAINKISLIGEEIGGGFENSFANCQSLLRIEDSIDAPNYNGTCASMFYECGNLKSFKEMNFSCTDMSNMFKGCTTLSTINVDYLPDLSNCVSFAHAFSKTSLQEISLPSIKEDSAISTMEGMFADCIRLQAVHFGENVIPSAVMSTVSMFKNTLVTTVMPISNKGKSLNMNTMYQDCANLTTCYSIIPEHVESLNYSFNRSGVSKVNMTIKSNKVSMNRTFAQCPNLTELNLEFNNDNKAGMVTNMVALAISNNLLTHAYIKFPEQLQIDAAYKTGMTYYWLFKDCPALKSIEVDMSIMQPGAIADFGALFEHDNAIESIKGFDLSHVVRTPYNKLLTGYSYYDSHEFHMLENSKMDLLKEFDVVGELPKSYKFNQFSSLNHIPFIKNILRHLAVVENETISFGFDVMSHIDPNKTAEETIDQELKTLAEAAQAKGWTITT